MRSEQGVTRKHGKCDTDNTRPKINNCLYHASSDYSNCIKVSQLKGPSTDFMNKYLFTYCSDHDHDEFTYVFLFSCVTAVGFKLRTVLLVDFVLLRRLREVMYIHHLLTVLF